MARSFGLWQWSSDDEQAANVAVFVEPCDGVEVSGGYGGVFEVVFDVLVCDDEGVAAAVQPAEIGQLGQQVLAALIFCGCCFL